MTTCEHSPTLFKVEDGRELPIMVKRSEYTSGIVWCEQCGWSELSNEEFAVLVGAFGGHA